MKRAFDLTIATLALAVGTPVLLAITAVVSLVDGRPVLFRQERVGRGGRPFTILKFRTMRPAPGGSLTIAGDPRITRLGAFLRRWKLDELPQLWNVLRGDMSLVGPRPEVPEYVEIYGPEVRAVLAVRPGITGPAQLEGFDEEAILRAASDPDRYYREVLLPQKLAIDLEYAREGDLATDLRILFRTLRRVVSRTTGASHARLG